MAPSKICKLEEIVQIVHSTLCMIISFQKYKYLLPQGLNYFGIFLLSLAIPPSASANLEFLCEKLKLDVCNKRSYSRRSNASLPTEQSSYRLNPSSLSTNKGIGIETLVNDGDYQFGIVTGNGRVGAGIGPTTTEDTFFGNMPLEAVSDYMTRVAAGRKYKSNKYTLATALNLYGGGKSPRPIKLNIGLIGRYVKDTSRIKTGGGVSLELGPINMGISKLKDEFYDKFSFNTYPYESQIFSVGLKLPYIAIDYSTVDNTLQDFEIENTITLLSVTAFWRNFMFTWASRKESSYRPRYNFDTSTFDFEREKRWIFNGVQISLFKNKAVIGLFYNYYLLQDYTVGLTMFF